MNVYLDNASTTALSDKMKSYLSSILDIYGNPSSSHSIGSLAAKLIDDARIDIANFINADVDDIYFTSGGSSANTAVISGYEKNKEHTVIYSPTCHKSILECVRNQKNINAVELKVESDGSISINHLRDLMLKHKDEFPRPLIVVEYANSEIGTIQDVYRIIEEVHCANGFVMLDCTGSISTIPLNIKELDVDFATFSGHKIGALKGCGVLYKRNGIQIKPLVYGSQEHGLFGGTENVIGIASIGKASELHDYSKVTSFNRDYVFDFIIKNIPDCYLIGSCKHRLSNNLYICFKGIDSESLMYFLDLNDIQVSTGSACNSKSIEPSPVLMAIDMNQDDMYSCIRLTFSGKETIEELDYVCKTIMNCVCTLRELNNELNN